MAVMEPLLGWRRMEGPGRAQQAGLTLVRT